VRILLLSPYPPERDGIGTYAAALHGALAADGHELGVIAARRSERPLPETLAALPAAGRSTDRALDAATAFVPDVVHVQFAIAAYGTLLPSLGRLVSRLRGRGVPIVVTMHEVTRDTASLPLAGAAIYRWVAGLADHVVVHTEAARRRLADLLGSGRPPVSVIPHPRTALPGGAVTPAQLRSRLGLGHAPVVLAFGFLDVDKGLQDLIAAAGRIAQTGPAPDVRFVVAGEVRRRFGPFRAFELRDRVYAWRLRRLARRLRLQRRVTFTGFVPADEVRAYFDMATIAVLPYRRSEQSGVASLASAAGTPVLTTDVGELAALSTVPPVPPRDPAQLAERLTGFLAAPRPPRRGSAGRAAGGDLAEIAATTAALYTDLVPTTTVV
jgi:glycosyltransferase involved in cell wall biosynthesis